MSFRGGGLRGSCSPAIGWPRILHLAQLLEMNSQPFRLADRTEITCPANSDAHVLLGARQRYSYSVFLPPFSWGAPPDLTIPASPNFGPPGDQRENSPAYCSLEPQSTPPAYIRPLYPQGWGFLKIIHPCLSGSAHLTYISLNMK